MELVATQELDNPWEDSYLYLRNFEVIRWGKTPKCAYCDSENLWERRKDNRFQCKTCRKTFSVTTNTFLHGSRLPLEKWIGVFYLISGANEKVSAKRIERAAKVTYKTAYYMSRKVRDIVEGIETENLEQRPSFRKIIERSMSNPICR